MSDPRQIKTPEAFAELYEPHRYKVFWGGRGGAKSTAFADALLLLGEQSPLRILCAREIQKSIKESVYQLLADRIIANEYQNVYEVLRGEIRGKNGTRFFFEGLWQNIDSIKSIEGVDICWIEEANTVSEESWRKLIPTIRKPGSEIWCSFNPELKSDPVYQRFVVNPPPNALVRRVSWRDNPWFTDEMRAEMEHLKSTDAEQAAHVWEGDLKEFADGAIYGAQLKQLRKDGRVLRIPIDPIIEVDTFWDLGRNDQTAIWFMQRIGAESRFIDYYESRLVGLDHYIEALKDKRYNYGRHYLPHDVEVTELTSNKSRREMLEAGGITPIIVVPRVTSINEGIAMTRRAFSTCYFDEERCADGLEALANYQYTFDEKYDTFRQTPLHNWASNGADAFRQFGQGYKHSVSITPQLSERRREAIKRNSRASRSWVV